MGWSGTWYSFSGLFLGAIRGLEFLSTGALCPVGWSGDLGNSFSVAGRADGPSQPRPRVCVGRGAFGIKGGTNLSDIGLNLSGSWQQGHSATYNTPSRT